MTKKTTAAKKAAIATVRVLVGFDVGQHKLKPNQLVTLAAAEAAEHEKAGRVSGDKAGIEYCLREFPRVPVLDLVGADPSGATEDEAVAVAAQQLATEIQQIEAALAAAAEADKPVLAEQLAAKQQELAELTE